jgi:hypothetical protein
LATKGGIRGSCADNHKDVDSARSVLPEGTLSAQGPGNTFDSLMAGPGIAAAARVQEGGGYYASAVAQSWDWYCHGAAGHGTGQTTEETPGSPGKCKVSFRV